MENHKIHVPNHQPDKSVLIPSSNPYEIHVNHWGTSHGQKTTAFPFFRVNPHVRLSKNRVPKRSSDHFSRLSESQLPGRRCLARARRGRTGPKGPKGPAPKAAGANSRSDAWRCFSRSVMLMKQTSGNLISKNYGLDSQNWEYDVYAYGWKTVRAFCFFFEYCSLSWGWGGMGWGGMLTFFVLRTGYIAMLLRSLGSLTTWHVSTLLRSLVWVGVGLGWGGGGAC